MSRLLVAEQRAATSQEQEVLARWSSWGAIPQVFDEDNDDWLAQRTQLRTILDERAYDEARRTTINAHYTDPAYVQEIWSTLTSLGFKEGRVLEPGSGVGTFIGMAPDGAQMLGVELDSTTAAISRGLYPHAEIHSESFADTELRAGIFDAAVGNVPFANVVLHDPKFNGGRHSMHNHFIIKSLALTRPGGMVAVLTSSFTMDASNPAARREMNSMADLVAAVRLPSGAFRRSAGTEAVTDFLLFRRREPGRPATDVTWETVSARIVDGELIKTNSYFDVHPEHVLGEFHVGNGMYGQATVSVQGDLAETPARFSVAMDDIVTRALERGEVFTAPSAELVAERVAGTPDRSAHWDGTILAKDEDSFVTVSGGVEAPFAVTKSAAVELRQLLKLRDGVTGLVNAEALNDDDTVELVDLRDALRADYETYVANYGALNRYTTRSTGRINSQTGEMGMARIKPRATALLRNDPHAARVMALERFDDETQLSAAAGILTHRVVVPRPVVHGVETATEGIAVSLDQTGEIDLDLIAHMLGQSREEAREQLVGHVFEDPTSHQLIHAPEYLSGDVRHKLEVAEEAAVEHPEFDANVVALRAVKPADIGMEEISVRLGAVWVDAATHQQFLSELLDDRSVRVENPLPGKWRVKTQKWGLKATNEWGTSRLSAGDIAEALMEQRPLVVKDKVEVGDKTRDVVNGVDTEAVKEKAEALQEAFASWVWEEPERAARLAGEYNRRFNGIVLRDYTQASDHLTLPGLASSFTPRPHQRAAVARIVAEPAVGLFHQVGAGKTAEMVMGAMELKRMGLVNKPAVIVPNHMLEQFSREWLQMYPQATLLAASTDDLSGEKRRLFVARAAANDWDAVVMTQAAFGLVGMSPEFEAEYVEKQAEEARAALESARDENSMSVKQIEKHLLRLEESVKNSLEKRADPGMTFESTGIDYLMVDEMHMYKNLKTDSSIMGAAIRGSKQATDLHSKLEYLRSRHGKRVVTGATATPLSNSVTEAYVMQRFLRPDLLEAAGVTSFDGWAATFAEPVMEMEMGPAGGFRMNTRLSRFKNVPEMLRMWHVFADVKTAEDLNLPTPEIAQRASDGQRQPEIIVIQPTVEISDYIAQIGERAELIASRSVEPDEDNMLLVSTDGRKAALDIRLVEPGTQPTGPVKLDAVAAQVLRQWELSKSNAYLDDVTREQSPIRGGLQLVFCDLSTPNPTRFNAYDELKHQLIDAGMPADSIRFMHEAKNDTQKARLFAAARAGHVAVLIGSTGKMGVGTNVQARLTAMHHVDCPWRPSDLEQRDGRGIRQGNQNAEVAIFRYVVERSFDAYSWQTINRKATFINQVMKGKLDSREIEDIGDSAMSAAEVKAIASGNPLLLDKANVDAALQKLRRQETAYRRSQTSLTYSRETAQRAIAEGEAAVEQLREATQRTTDVSGDSFTMRIGDRTFTSRSDAGAAINRWAHDNGVQYLSPRNSQSLALGTIAGHRVQIVARSPQSLTAQQGIDLELSLAGVPRTESRVNCDEFMQGGIGMIRQLENKTTSLDRVLRRVEQTVDGARRTVSEADQRLGQPFPRKAELEAATRTAADVDQRLAAKLNEDDEARRRVSEPVQPDATPEAAQARPQGSRRRPTAGSSAPHVFPGSASPSGPRLN